MAFRSAVLIFWWESGYAAEVRREGASLLPSTPYLQIVPLNWFSLSNLHKPVSLSPQKAEFYLLYLITHISIQWTSWKKCIFLCPKFPLIKTINGKLNLNIMVSYFIVEPRGNYSCGPSLVEVKWSSVYSNFFNLQFSTVWARLRGKFKRHSAACKNFNMALWGGNSCWLPRNNGFRKMKKLNRICFSSPKKANAIRVCVPECHFPGTGIFPEKSGKSSVPSIREEDVPIPAFGTGYFPSSIRSGITREFLSASRMKINKNITWDVTYN